jgi:hypothetical protein
MKERAERSALKSDWDQLALEMEGVYSEAVAAAAPLNGRPAGASASPVKSPMK